jgi:hypothetical protein
MKPTIKIRFTESQIALVIRAHPNCNLDRLAEISFEFDKAGRIVDCVGTIKDGGDIDRNYAGSGLARLYGAARRQLKDRQGSATILQFSNRARLANAQDRAVSTKAPHRAEQDAVDRYDLMSEPSLLDGGL